MKKFTLMPLLFFKISTCMKLSNINFKAIFGTTSSNNQPERLRSLRLQANDFTTVRKQTIPTNPNESIKSFTHSFKQIMPPPTKYVTQAEMEKKFLKEKNAQKKEISKIRIQDAIISTTLFTLSKIDYSWIFQTVKNFFNPNAQLNEA